MEKAIIISKETADRIEAFLAIDDIDLYDGDLDIGRDSCDLIGRATFDDGAQISVCLMSGDVNYYISSFFDGPNGEQDEGEPDFTLTDVVYEHNGVDYVLRFEVA